MRLSLLLPLAFVAGCQSSSPPAPAPQRAAPAASAVMAPGAAPAAAPSAAAAQRFGAPITAARAVALSEIASSPDRWVDAVVKTTGTVSAVCQAAGCWMEITDATSKARIRMSGHSFFVPKNCSGRRAVVQAKVLKSATPSACAGHCEGASGGACQGGCGAGAEAKAERVELEATGVELL